MGGSAPFGRRGERFAALVLVVALAGAAAAQPVKLKSVKVELPPDPVEFTGPGSDAVNGICLACHSAEMVLNQPKLSAATWKAEVNKMRATYKAPVEDADVAGIVDYLVKRQGS